MGEKYPPLYGYVTKRAPQGVGYFVWIQLVTPDLLGPLRAAERGNYLFMVKCPDHYTKFKAVYFISAKDKALATLFVFAQDFVLPTTIPS